MVVITYTYWLLATLILLSHIPQQESKNIIMQNPNGAYPAEDRPRLREILQLWKLEILYDRLVDQFITITVLKLLQKDDINELISNKFPIGVKVMFAYKLKEWQKRNPLNAAEYSRLNRQYNV